MHIFLHTQLWEIIEAAQERLAENKRRIERLQQTVDILEGVPAPIAETLAERIAETKGYIHANEVEVRKLEIFLKNITDAFYRSENVAQFAGYMSRDYLAEF